MALGACALPAAASAATNGVPTRADTIETLKGLPKPSKMPADKPPEADTGGAVELSPFAPSSSGPIQTLATPAGGEFMCSLGSYAYIAAQPSGFITGNCAYGNALYRTSHSTVNGVDWDGGYITDPQYQGCGWMRSADDTQTSSVNHTGCAFGSVGYNQDEYMRYNGSQPIVWDDGSGQDGQAVWLSHDCIAYANVRPWLSGQVLPARLWGGAIFHVGDQSPAGGPRIRIRYLTKYQAQNPEDGVWWDMLMVHDTQAPATGPRWFFMPRWCFPV